MGKGDRFRLEEEGKEKRRERIERAKGEGGRREGRFTVRGET